MYEFKTIDLDTLFSSTIKMDGDVITTSASLTAICHCLGAPKERFERQGLGNWMGVAIHIEDHGNVLFAVQEGKECTDGASIWVQKNRVDAQLVINLLSQEMNLHDVKFMHPVTGTPIFPEATSPAPQTPSSKPPKP